MIKRDRAMGQAADLFLVSLDVIATTPHGILVKAVLRNGVPPATEGDEYPGGGELQIWRTSGGTILTPLPDPGPPSPFPSLAIPVTLATPDPGTIIIRIPIPRLPFGQSIPLIASSSVNGIFTAAAVAVPAGGSVLVTPLPEANPANDSKTLNTLAPFHIDVKTETLGQVQSLTSAIQMARIVLDRNNSSISIPGLFNSSFTINGVDKEVDLGPIPFTVTYFINDVQSTGLVLSYENGGLALDISFADKDHALTTNAVVPDLNVKNFKIKLSLPLTYVPDSQYFLFENPTAVVTGDWSGNGPLGFVIDLLIKDVNKSIQDAVVDTFKPQLPQLSFNFTTLIHDLIAGGRITAADVQQDSLSLSLELAKPLFG